MPLFLRALMAMLLATLMSTAMAAQAASDTIDPDAPITTASAASPAVPAASTPVVTRATIKFELLQALADDGIITAEQKSAAAAKYTAKDDTTRLVAYTDDESWTRHVTWSLTLKCLGLLLLFAAMWGWVKEFARLLGKWIPPAQSPRLTTRRPAVSLNKTRAPRRAPLPCIPNCLAPARLQSQ